MFCPQKAVLISNKENSVLLRNIYLHHLISPPLLGASGRQQPGAKWSKPSGMRWKCLTGQGKGKEMVGIAGVLLIGALTAPLMALVAGMVG